MASFDFFSQPQGPTVPISLFSDAATAGIQAGNALPTPLTAEIQGGIKGYQQGQQMLEADQAATIRQNQIENLPTENRLREELLRKYELSNQVDEMQVRIQDQTEELTLRNTKAKLENEFSQLEQQTQDLDNQDLIAEITARGQATDKNGRIYSTEDLLKDPSLSGTLFRNPKYADQVLGSVQGRLSPEMQQRAAQSLGLLKDREFQLQKEELDARAKQALLKGENKDLSNFLKSPGFQYATQGLTAPSEIIERVEVYPRGTKTLTEDGRILSDVPDRVPEDKEELNQYSVFRDGKLIQHVPREEAEKYFGLKKLYDTEYSILKDDIYGPGASKQEQRGQPQAQNQPAPQAPTQAGIGGGLTEETPSVGNVGNQNIIDQKRQAFEELKKTPPRGIEPRNLEERLRAKKDAIRKRIGQTSSVTPSPNAPDNSAMGITNYVRNLPQSTAPQVSVPQEPRSPSLALKEFTKKDVVLNVEKETPLSKVAFQNISTDPLLSKEPAIIKGLAATESGGKRNAVSPTGVRGLLQVTKSTAAMYGLNRDIPEENVMAGKLYLYDNIVQFGGNLRLALAAYNAGPGTITNAIEATGTTDWNKIKDHLRTTLSPQKFKETSAYPDKVISMASSFVGTGSMDEDRDFTYLLERNNLLTPKVA